MYIYIYIYCFIGYTYIYIYIYISCKGTAEIIADVCMYIYIYIYVDQAKAHRKGRFPRVQKYIITFVCVHFYLLLIVIVIVILTLVNVSREIGHISLYIRFRSAVFSPPRGSLALGREKK